MLGAKRDPLLGNPYALHIGPTRLRCGLLLQELRIIPQGGLENPNSRGIATSSTTTSCGISLKEEPLEVAAPTYKAVLKVTSGPTGATNIHPYRSLRALYGRTAPSPRGGATAEAVPERGNL